MTLPFIVSFDSTCTLDDSMSVLISCMNEVLRKRKFAMDVVIDSGDGDKRDGNASLICKGSFVGRRKMVEKLA